MVATEMTNKYTMNTFIMMIMMIRNLCAKTITNIQKRFT